MLKIGQPEVKTGLGSILGSSQMMWHMPLSVNAELSLTGDQRRAYESGEPQRLMRERTKK